LKRNRSQASPLDNPAFRRWFGDSVVVDENGEPLVVYHGGFDVIGSESGSFRLSEDGLLGPGIYFTPERSFAESFLWKQRGGSASVGSFFLRIERPLAVFSDEPYAAIGERIRRSYKRGLIDGVLLFNRSGPIEEILVFDPRQVKAALANDGSFDSENPDVRRNPSRTLSAEETADEYDRGRANEFLTGGCLDWAQAYMDHMDGGSLVGVYVNGSMEHVMVKDGRATRDAVGTHTPRNVIAWFQKTWRTKDVKLSEPRQKDLRLLETDDDRYAEAVADVFNEYQDDPKFKG